MLGLLVLSSVSIHAQDLKTIFYQNYNHWKFQNERIETFFEGSYDEWHYGDLEIRPRYRGRLDEWLIGDQVILKTRYEKSYSRWEINGHDWYLEVERSMLGNVLNWQITGDFSGTFSMIFTNDFERWNFDDLSTLPKDIRAAIVFIAVFTAVHQAK